ncbi:hypothetical protein BH20ACT24_BH20ACT24_13850 [soil metagenome]
MVSLVSVAAGLSVFLGTSAFLFRIDSATTRMIPAVGVPSEEASAMVGLLNRIGGSRLASIGDSRLLRRRLRLAGEPRSLEFVLGLKVGTGVVAGGSAMLLSPTIPPALLLAPFLAALAFRVPDVRLARLARTRQARIDRQVVDLMELLVATTQAGLPAPEALRRAAEALPNPLGDELRVAVRQMDLGLAWRHALAEVVEQSESGSLRRLATSLGRSQRLGTSVRGALRGIAQEMRTESRVRAEEAARRAPVKMLFPLILLILPAFLLLTVGPVLLATIRSLQSG